MIVTEQQKNVRLFIGERNGNPFCCRTRHQQKDRSGSDKMVCHRSTTIQ